MHLGANADGELLQRALEGQAVDQAGVVALVAVAREVQALDTSRLAPRAEFVAGLRQRLLDETAAEAYAALPGARDGSSARSRDRGPAVVRFGRSWRILVAAVAALLVASGSLCALSRTALPGDRLYPIKQLLDRVALELQREPLGLGLTHLAQGREHVSDAGRLLARAEDGAGGVAPGGSDLEADPALDEDLASTLDAATQSSTEGHTVLLTAYRSLDDAEALTALTDYYAQIVPAVDTLREQALPRAATAAWQRLHDVLEQDRDSTLRELAACTTCGEASGQARSLLTRDTTPVPTSAAAESATGAPSTDSTASRPPRSTSTRTAGPGSGGGSRGSGSAGPSPGGSIRLPTVSVTSDGVSAGGGGATLPAASVSLPGVGVSTSGATFGGGGVTLPGATLSVPTVTVPLPVPLP